MKQRNFGRGSVRPAPRRPRPSTTTQIFRELEAIWQTLAVLTRAVRSIDEKIDALGTSVTPAELARIQALTVEGRRIVDRMKAINERTPPAKPAATKKRK